MYICESALNQFLKIIFITLSQNKEKILVLIDLNWTINQLGNQNEINAVMKSSYQEQIRKIIEGGTGVTEVLKCELWRVSVKLSQSMKKEMWRCVPEGIQALV